MPYFPLPLFLLLIISFFFFFNDTAPTEIYTLSLHDALPIFRRMQSGQIKLLPLGQRIALKVMQILREEMNRIGGQEFYLPALHPAEVWQESGRSEEHTSELQSRSDLVCRLLLEKKKQHQNNT